MHNGHTRYTSTLLNIKIQYAHDLSVVHFIKIFFNFFRITLFAQGKLLWYFFSQHILNRATIKTQVLFCCLKCPLATTSLFFFITVMQNYIN